MYNFLANLFYSPLLIQLNQLNVLQPTKETANALIPQRVFKPTPFMLMMSNVVSQFILIQIELDKVFQLFSLPTVMPKINFKDLKPNLPSHKVTKQLQDLDMLELLCQLQMEVGLLATMVLSMTMFQCHALILTGKKYGFKIKDI